jgi:hypothetical protein
MFKILIIVIAIIMMTIIISMLFKVKVHETCTCVYRVQLYALASLAVRKNTLVKHNAIP